MPKLNGKTVFITGASRGIGAASARLFAAEGANVALIARGAEAITTLASEIGDKALAVPCDISSYEAIDAAASAVEARFGQIDILINNAGVIEPIAPLSGADPEAWSKLIDINVKGVFYAMRRIVPNMVERGAGTVLTVSSGAAHRGIEGWSAYCSSKAGAAMLTEMLDLEERGHGIRAMGLSPGTVATQMQREIKASGVNAVSQLDWSDHIPPEWPARALLWMCGAEADAHLGEELQLRDDDLRRKIGLIE
ncbi:SDR family oxidoreductase [Celeribacter neptunius]|uniref:NADP-dependent 3-hydroxy acid dehydrogenase YdfG n=1 Tax=Celeribacter neptunius TaxID=588602 RepID=A0A1I3S4R6_9RHOB|nr:SDR family oxidoreductase [Celeribacter neptunius]SFJ52577.1 NADP-dependent 3-hydroxy acid dehydrogenase YdfG [Celeribacter neptunius]